MSDHPEVKQEVTCVAPNGGYTRCWSLAIWNVDGFDLCKWHALNFQNGMLSIPAERKNWNADTREEAVS